MDLVTLIEVCMVVTQALADSTRYLCCHCLSQDYLVSPCISPSSDVYHYYVINIHSEVLARHTWKWFLIFCNYIPQSIKSNFKIPSPVVSSPAISDTPDQTAINGRLVAMKTAAHYDLNTLAYLYKHRCDTCRRVLTNDWSCIKIFKYLILIPRRQ